MRDCTAAAADPAECWELFGGFSFSGQTSSNPSRDCDAVSPCCSRAGSPEVSATHHHNSDSGSEVTAYAVDALARRLDVMGRRRQRRRRPLVSAGARKGARVRALRQRGCRALVGDERHVEAIRRLAGRATRARSVASDSSAEPALYTTPPHNRYFTSRTRTPSPRETTPAGAAANDDGGGGGGGGLAGAESVAESR
ncbi:MAG: hypothetical protein M1839_008259 [Geoglossum umbratile]|nr:MAG: hypothetical protein M1839_008259 [Geoglossum umbratile]